MKPDRKEADATKSTPYGSKRGGVHSTNCTSQNKRSSTANTGVLCQRRAHSMWRGHIHKPELLCIKWSYCDPEPFQTITLIGLVRGPSTMLMELKQVASFETCTLILKLRIPQLRAVCLCIENTEQLHTRAARNNESSSGRSHKPSLPHTAICVHQIARTNKPNTHAWPATEQQQCKPG